MTKKTGNDLSIVDSGDDDEVSKPAKRPLFSIRALADSDEVASIRPW